MTIEQKRALIEPEHGQLSVSRQCELVSLNRSSFYYQPAGETVENVALMRLIDAQFLETPWHGSRQMAGHLGRDPDAAGIFISGRGDGLGQSKGVGVARVQHDGCCVLH